MVRLTEPEGSVVRPNLAEPPSSADTDADADSSVVHYYLGVGSIDRSIQLERRRGFKPYFNVSTMTNKGENV